MQDWGRGTVGGAQGGWLNTPLVLLAGVSQGKFFKFLLLEMMHVKHLCNQALGWLFSESGSQTCSILITWELVRNADPPFSF